MQRYLIIFSYDGTLFFGYQRQPNKRTVQNEIEKVLSKICNSQITIHASGRTDKKAHALNQHAHFDCEIKINLEKFKRAINTYLPKDIYIKKIKKVENNFHARYSVKSKEYIYLLNTKEYNVFKRNYVFQYNKELDLIKMKEAIKDFKGKKDFASFSCKEDLKANTIRTIYKASLKQEKENLVFTFKASGFLKYQVRNMVGTLIEIGEGKKEPQEIKSIMNKKDRIFAGKTAHPEGLYLKNVKY